MTIKECLRKGLQSGVSSLKRWQSVDVDFIDSDGKESEVQFDVMFIGTKDGKKELESLYADFCKENGYSENTVVSITVVASANSYEALQLLCM